MTENVESLILEHLKALRNQLRDFKADIRSDTELVKARLNSLENQVAATSKQLAFVHEDIAGIPSRLDKFDSRLDRIERRLDLANAP
jgi:chromosome segregation ATPase